MKNIISLTVFLFINLCVINIGQTQNTSAPATPKTGFLPHNLGQNVNTVECAEINPVISPDGKTLYFTRLDHPENNYGHYESHDIWYSVKQADGSWNKAARMPDNINIGKFNALLSISADGKTILLNGRYTKNGHWKHRGLSTSTQTSVGWTNPTPLKVPKFSRKNHGISSNAFLNSKGNILVLAYTKKFHGHKLDLYISKFEDGKWRKPKKLKDICTRAHTEEAPFLSNDGKTLYFSSHNRANGFGKFDVYKCTRLDDSYLKWSEPKLLSDTINTLDWESYFKTNLRGSYAFFASNHGVNETAHNQHTHSHADIFGIKIFEENPYTLVKGFIKNTSTNENLDPKFTYQIYVNDKLADSVNYDRDSSKYEIKLPFGNIYKIDARIKGFTYKVDTIDNVKTKEFEQKNIDLAVTPIPYSEISGFVFQTGTNIPLPQSANPKISVNGKIIDSIKVDPNTGAYKVNLTNGKSHSLQVIANNYVALPSMINLENTKMHSSITHNLTAEQKKAAKLFVSGVVIDKKTGKPVEQNQLVQVMVNSIPTVANYNSATGEYKLELPQNNEYIINAACSGFYPVYETVAKTESPENIYIKRDLYITPIEVGQSVKINNIFFETGKANLMPASFSELNRVIKFLSDNPTIKIQIQGHTDNVGNAVKNLALSKARAKAVASYITDNGIEVSRISSEGFGSTKPVADNKTAAGKASNRRVEFKIVGK